MGLIRAGIGAVSSTLADQWKEFFYCDSLDSDTLMVRGQRKTSGKSSNKGNDNVISNGSGIAVADGQCMIIVEQGKVVEVCAEPGNFTFDSSSEPSIFTGDLEEGIRNTFNTIVQRFTFGGSTGKDQRVYYINTKEIMDNKFGTPTPVPFRVVDKNIGMDIDIAIRCNGLYSFKIVDPLLFYTNVCSNVSESFERELIEQQLKGELLNALQPAFATVSSLGVRYSELPGHAMTIADSLNEILSKKWSELRGLKIVSFAINSVSTTKEYEDKISQMQMAGIYRDPSMGMAALAQAQADAMRAAASNEGGAMTGFMGLNMAQQGGGIAQAMAGMAQQQQMNQHQSQIVQQPQQVNGDTWTCSCGNNASGKFCTECGAKKPEEGWTCTHCNAVNKGKFCAECGAKKPESSLQYACDKCGWEPVDPQNPPKFCPECGDVFDANDIKK